MGWKKYYSGSEHNNTFNYNYGKVFDTKILLYQNDSFYIGQVNINNKKHGIGKLTYKDGKRYQGFWITTTLKDGVEL